MPSIIDLFLVWWLRSGRYRWSRLRRRIFERRYLSTAIPTVSSLEEIEACLTQVTWTMDGPLHLYDSISYPEMVWARKKDDCDGFSTLAATLLQKWQPDTSPVLLTTILRPVRNSHTVCGFKSPDGGFWFFDNYSLRRGDFPTCADIINEIKGEARLVCWDVRNPFTFELIEFHRA